jgi:multiple antibiotic resistance protein
MEMVSAALVLFFVMDPLGNVPVFISVLERVEPRRRRVVLARELLIALGLLVGFLFFGQTLLEVLHLDTDAIRVGGGIVLFLIALRLVFPSERLWTGDDLDGEPLVFPLAVPMVAGPSALATILLLAQTSSPHRLSVLIAIASAWAASAIILFASSGLLRIVGRRGLMAAERLMGMLLVLLAVQMVMEGVRAFLADP